MWFRGATPAQACCNEKASCQDVLQFCIITCSVTMGTIDLPATSSQSSTANESLMPNTSDFRTAAPRAPQAKVTSAISKVFSGIKRKKTYIARTDGSSAPGGGASGSAAAAPVAAGPVMEASLAAGSVAGDGPTGSQPTLPLLLGAVKPGAGAAPGPPGTGGPAEEARKQAALSLQLGDVVRALSADLLLGRHPLLYQWQLQEAAKEVKD